MKKAGRVKGAEQMYGFITGVTDTDDINFCPKCGSDDLDRNIDGTAKCCECGYAFGVVETEESNC